ncbi:hypothetical protein N9Y67_01185 [Pseudomonadota bacterium]|nr:hypothetical protein [Pseudomonadota bacterium]
MTNLPLTLFLAFLVSNSAWAYLPGQLIEYNSLPKAAPEIAPMDNPASLNVEKATPYTHESEKYNSLFHGALAKQGVGENIHLNAESEVNYSRKVYHSNEKYNSLSRGAMAR